MKRLLAVAAVVLATHVLSACSGNGPFDASRLATGITGTAVKGPIAGAQVHAFYFDETGALVEIAATNAPVFTNALGDYDFRVNFPDMSEVTSPIIIRTVGGTMDGAPAPTLEGVIADPEALRYGQVTLACQLSTATCVAAGLLKRRAQELGTAPQPADAREIVLLVETELGVDLSECAADHETAVAMCNECVDQNLDLADTPSPATVVGDYVDYLVANLSSTSRSLDGMMADPANPGSDIPASFLPFPAVADALPGGPPTYVDLALEADKAFMGIDEDDTMTVTATVTDATGQPIPIAADLWVMRLSGTATAERVDPPAIANELEILVTADTVGETVFQVSCPLANGNLLAQTITVKAVDLVTDSDGDGTSDGEEMIGWTVIVDGSGYGAAANGAFLTVREVTSDPGQGDTDGDGLSDNLEYLIRSDPRSADTDGDGLTDNAEWTRWMTNPNSVDSDGDARGPDRNDIPNAGLFDRNELFLFDGNELKTNATSPTLEDTDGDGRTDYEEADHPTRSPLIANLPKLEIEIVDEIDVRLDVEYAEEEGTTSQYGTEFSRSSTVSETVSHSGTVGASLMVGMEVTGTAGIPPSASATAKTELTLSASYTYTNTQESSNTAQQSYSEYTTDARTRTETAASGSMSMGIRLRNAGQITYTVTDLGMTARIWDPLSQSFRTLATLTPVLEGGFTLAPGATSPVLQLDATDVNASRIKQYLARPDSLHLEPAYYELENAEGLNFAYLEEVTGPQTARVVIDFGNGTTEEYRVGTNVERDDDGTYSGVSLSNIIGDILAIPYATLPRQTLDSQAQTNELVLHSVRGIATRAEDPRDGFWMVVVGTDGPPEEPTDFEARRIHGGESVLMAYVSDEDRDGLLSSEEQHFRTLGTDDSDGDLLTDKDEIRGRTFPGNDPFPGADPDGIPCGWVVTVKDREGQDAFSYPVVSDPSTPDQDGDGVDDSVERDQGTDPTRPDTDEDGLIDNILFDKFPLRPARILRVKSSAAGNGDGSSWDKAYAELHDALTEAERANETGNPQDHVAEIWVAAGTYTPPANGSFVLVNYVGLYGGFTGTDETKRSQRFDDPVYNNTELFGEYTRRNVILAGPTVQSPTVLDGFRISGADDTGWAGAGGAIKIEGNLTLRNLFIHGNRSDIGGAILYMPYDNEPPGTVITDCIFSDNRAQRGGALFALGSKSVGLRVTNCEFWDNQASIYGGAACVYYWAEFSGCVFNGNTGMGSGIYFSDGSWAGHGEGRIEKCQFVNNNGTAVQADSMSPGLLIAQCTFTGNVSPTSMGAGIHATDESHLEVVNCTIADNDGWGLWMDGSAGAYASLAVRNSIVYGNLGQITQNQTWVTIRYTLVEGGYPGASNISGNPKFVNGLLLDSESPCIDRGFNYLDYDPWASGFQLLPETDLAGNWRITDGNGDGTMVVDMGAYEYQGGG